MSQYGGGDTDRTNTKPGLHHTGRSVAFTVNGCVMLDNYIISALL